jgi:branched-chain amino acid transport system permease protein
VDFYLAQALNGLASASSIFLVASGLSLIFGVTRIVNFAHGSFYMLGAYGAYSLSGWLMPLLGGAGFWVALPLAALAVAVLGALVELVLLRRIYRAPELFQLLATFGLTLMVEDVVLMVWGPTDLLGPRAPGLSGALALGDILFPSYDLILIALGPLVMGGLWLLLTRTRWGVLVRAATQDRQMVAALGVNQGWLFTTVFALGVFLAALGGAAQIPREAVHHGMGLQVIVSVFVVVVVGGLGHVGGAFLAAVLIAELNAFGILLWPKSGMVMMFLVMAVVLVVRPWGLLGRPLVAVRGDSLAALPSVPWRPLSSLGLGVVALLVALAASAVVWADGFLLSVLSEALIFALFAASLHFLMGVGGMVSFGHAAVFGLGAYGAALTSHWLDVPMVVGLLAGVGLSTAGAALFGWFCVRLSGVYLAMLTLAFAQITWSIIFQGGELTGGDNGLLGVWPADWVGSERGFFLFTLGVVVLALAALRRFSLSPLGYALRGCRDAPLRAEAIGLNRGAVQWLGFVLAGAFAGVAGGLYAYLKGSVFPDVLAVSTSVDGLVMVLLGGLQSLSGPVVGAATYKVLSIFLISATDQWRLILGAVIVLLVLLLPQGLVGLKSQLVAWWQRRRAAQEEPQ